MVPNINCQITKDTIQEQSAHPKLKGTITPTSFLGGCHIRPPIVKHPTKKVVDQFWHNL